MWSYCLVLFVVYIYNLLTIGSSTLCFMHLVSGRSLNIFLAKFFLTGQVMSYPGWFKSGWPQRNQVGSQVNPFLLWIKKIRFMLGIFRVGSDRKILTRFTRSTNHTWRNNCYCYTTTFTPLKLGLFSFWSFIILHICYFITIQKFYYFHNIRW